MAQTEDKIIKEILDVCMNMGEPERTKYLKENFIIVKKLEYMRSPHTGSYWGEVKPKKHVANK